MTQFTARHRSHLEALWQQPTVDRQIDRQISADRQTSATASTAEAIRQFAKDLLAFLTGAQQMRVWTKSTKQGVLWFAYDPVSGQRIGHSSEEALRIWLESRYQH